MRATAFVLWRADRGELIGDGALELVSETELAVRALLRVEPAGEPAFEVEQKLRFSQAAIPTPGAPVAVIYDPADRERIIVDRTPHTRAASGEELIAWGEISRALLADPTLSREETAAIVRADRERVQAANRSDAG